MRYGQVGKAENLSNDGSTLSVEQGGQGISGTGPDWQTTIGTAFSDLIVSGQRGTEKAVNWLGEDNATAAGMAIMVALGGPVKTGLGMAFSASPAGKAIESVKGQIKDWLTPINGTYLFGADTEAQQNGVRPASEAVAGTTVELGSSLLGTSLAASIKGIIGISKGFGAKVDAAGKADIPWVDEKAAMGSKARDYNDSAPGARSNMETKASQAPVLERNMPDGTTRQVRFDGVDGNVLVDRKVSVVTTPKAKDQALRQSQALSENGLTGRWEVPTQAQAKRAKKMLEELGIKNIEIKVVE